MSLALGNLAFDEDEKFFYEIFDMKAAKKDSNDTIKEMDTSSFNMDG
jgi:hypothetical protein